MRKKMHFIWIDDNPKERQPESVNMSKRLGVRIQYKDVKNNDLHKTLTDILQGNQPELILIDHKFDDGDSGIYKTGSSIAALIRDTWPSCPIICITGVDLHKVDSQKRALYQAVFQFHNISAHDATILSIAKSYQKILSTPVKKLSDLFLLLQAPTSEHHKLETILPSELKENFKDPGLANNISHWVRNVLMERPGFLYDRLWASTLLGIKDTSFHKVADIFKSAKYRGIFADESNSLWWKSSLLEILSSKVKVVGLPYEKGRKLKQIKKADYSKGYPDESDLPETVAYEDETPASKMYPMSLKNTRPHPAYPDMLFFEEIRLQKPQE